MRVRVKLMGVLKARTPAEGAIELADGATIADALRALDIAPASSRVVSVNGELERNRERALRAGDELTVVPPVGGG